MFVEHSDMPVPDPKPIPPPRAVNFHPGARTVRWALWIGVGFIWIIFGRMGV